MTTTDTSAHISVGDRAPDFEVSSTAGTLKLSELLAATEKGVVLYFYPKAATPGCSKQACDFRDSLNTFKAAGYSVVGVSPDSLERLQKWVDKEQFNFPMVSDPEHELMNVWGTYGEKMNYGRLFMGVIRSTFVIGKDGTVTVAQRNVKATGHVARLAKELGI